MGINRVGSGIRFRRQKIGPELALVNSFLEKIEEVFSETGFKFSYFIEPFIDIGFPDIVGVLWDESALKSWSSARLLINKNDIRVLNHINLLNYPTKVSEIEAMLGFSQKFLNKSIERLVDAQLVNLEKQFIVPRPIEEVFAPKKIVAIEAKMANWRDAFNQAEMNKWFSSESYVLFPGEIAKDRVIEYSKRKQVGLILKEGNKFQVSKAPQITIPESYGAWLVNEWLGKNLYCQI